LAGVGKTELAAEYFHRRAPELSFAWWVASHDEELYVKDLASAAAAVGLPAASQPSERVAASELIDWLSSRSDWLLVLDDVRDPRIPAELLAVSEGAIVVTTTSLGWPGPGEILQLETWDRSHSIAFLASRIPEDGPLDRLSEQVGDLPLALVQARSYIAATGIPVARYLELFSSRTRDLLERGDPGGHRLTLTATVELALSQLSDDARAFLLICAAYAPDPIPIEIFRSLPQLPEFLPRPLSDDLSLEDSISELRRFALVRRDGPSLTVHQLVQQIALAVADHRERRVAILRAIPILGSATPMWPNRSENWSRCERLLPHVLTVIDHPDASLVPEALAWLLNRMGVYVDARGDESLALEMLERARELAQRSEDRALLASVLNNLGNVVASQGDLNRGIELVERGLREKRQMNAAPFLLAPAVGALGSLARRKGDFVRALELHREALQLWEEAPEADDYAKASEQNDIGVCAARLGLFDEALAMHSKALETFTRLQGSDGPAVGTTHAALAIVHDEMGDYETALAHQKQALAIAEQHHDDNHPALSPLLSQMGLILIRLERYQQARESLERAVAITEERLGPNHYELGFRIGNLGIALMKLGEIDESIRLHERSLTLIRDGLGDRHRSVSIQQAHLAEALQMRGEFDRAKALLREATYRLLALPPDSIFSGLVESYVDLCNESGDLAQGSTILDDAIGYIDSMEASSRPEWFAWLAGVCFRVGDRDRFVICMQKSRESLPNLGV
jgi:tetratricopeptide (TPR) repeat protein